MEDELMEIIEEAPSALEVFFTRTLPTLPPISMCLITLMLLFVFLCAWKAPRWIKPVGSIALAIALITITWPFLSTFREDALVDYRIAPMVYYDGIIRFTLLLIYGVLVFIVSRIVYLIQKSRN